MNRGQFAYRHNSDGKERYNTTLLPSIPKSETDIYVITVIGDRLDSISYNYYGTPNYWWIIAAANGVGLGTTTLEGGIQLRIPQDIAGVEQAMERLQQRG